MAVAVIRSHGREESDVARIRREAQAMGRLGDHPHIVTIHDVGEENGETYIIVQYMAGGSLDELLRRADKHVLPITQALRVGTQTCRALEYAHGHSIIHRDLKPGNIWFAVDGTVKLGDFGLAVALDRSRLTAEGTMVGTLAYMPPEQALGRSVDARSDLYSLGAILYEMVTGQPPFLGNMATVIAQQINTRPVAPSWHNPQVPRHLDALILQLLAKVPDERPKSATAVREALESIAASAVPGAAFPLKEARPFSPLTGGVFVGREESMRELRASLDDMLSGHGELLLLVGERGIGKTRTAEELATYARLRGTEVLWGRCYEGEGAPAMWPWLQVLRARVCDRDPKALQAEMGAGAGCIAELVPEVHERFPGLPAVPALGPAQARFRLFDCITTFLRNAAKNQPLVLVLDDLQWADAPSLLFLEFLQRELSGSRLLLLGTYRDVIPDQQRSQMLERLSREPRGRRIALSGLGEHDVARFIEMAARAKPSAALMTSAYKKTGGNPSLLHEIVQLLRREEEPEGAGQTYSSTTARWEMRNVASRLPAGEAPPVEGERRQLTVLFCDLVESTQMASRLDPEDWHEIATGYQRTAAEVIEGFGGHVAKYLGDELVIYFGYPHAYDDAAERAVRASLALLDVMETLNQRVKADHGLELALSVGIHTGSVVVSEGGGNQVEVFGDTPAVAARVQALAEPDSVLITEATYRLVAGLFIVEEGGPRALKGVRDAVPVYRVRRPSEVRGGFHARAARGLTCFVDREQERRLLLDRWEQAREGNGQAVLVTGEAGIGKSRLVRQLKEDLGGVPHTWIECVGSPFRQHTPFYPVIDLLQQGLAWGSADSVDARLARLERGLGAAGLLLDEAVPLLASLLSLPLPVRYAPLLVSPEGQRRKLLATLAAWLFALARNQPVVFLLEDLKWVDPSTLEVLTLFAEQGATVPLLVVYTSRPEFRPPWSVRSHHTHVTLNRLNQWRVREMVANISADAALAADVVEAVVSRTDGVPLFIEELTKAVMETEEGLGVHEIPMTLQDSLMARLDRLGVAKGVAQLGAVLGREFSYNLLRAVSPLPETNLQEALVRLAEAELVYPRGLPPDSNYLFKHALVREAAYGSLLKSRRRELHGQVARILVERFTEISDAEPELLAYHYSEAGELELAVAAWRQAGERAISRFAFAEGVAHLTRGLEALRALPDTPARGEQELTLQITLGAALNQTRGFGAETAMAFARARELSDAVRDPTQLLLLLLGTWGAALARGDLHAAREVAQQMVRTAEREGTRAWAVWAQLAEGIIRHTAGDFVAARDNLERALTLYDEEDHRWWPSPPGPLTLGHLACVLWTLGFAEEAHRRAEEALAAAQRRDEPNSVGQVQCLAVLLCVLLREPTATIERADTLIQLCTDHNLSPIVEPTRVMRGWAVASLGRYDEGLAELRQGLQGLQRMGQLHSRGFLLGLLADAHAQGGALGEALAVLDDALATLGGEDGDKPDLLRLRGDLLARQCADACEVEASYREAIDLAHRQGARAFELRALTSFGRWLRSQARCKEARTLLAPLYASFTEGFETRDLREAKTLLEDLA